MARNLGIQAPDLRVLHLITHLEPGGIETWLLGMLCEIDRTRCAMDICCKGPEIGSLASQARSAGAIVHHCRLRPTHVEFVVGLLRVLREGDYDLAHVHLGSYSGLGVKIAHMAGLPAITTFHSARFPAQTWTRNVIVRQIRSLYSRISVTYALAKAEIVTGTSKAILDELKPESAKDPRFRLLRLGVQSPETASEQEKRRFRSELGLSETVPLLIQVGSFRPAKNHSATLDVLARVVRRRPDVILILVGDGELRPVITRQIRERGLETAVRMMGRRPDAIHLMSMCDILLMPSKNEGFGLAAVEANGAGLPVVGSRVGGLVEAISDGETGFLFPPEDRSAMAEKVLHLLDSPELRREIGVRARNRCAHLYSRQGAAQRLLELYDDCLRDYDAVRAHA